MGEILLERSAGQVWITLHGPDRRNAISVAMWQALRQHFDELGGDPTVRCIVIRGAGGHFSGGADITEFPQLRADASRVREYHESVIAPALDAISNCPHPTLAAIEGACIGGGLEIAGRCDLRICATGARFGIPITRLGFPMAPDEMAGVLALVGPAVLLELLLEGALLDARSALAKGLVTRVVADDLVYAEAQATALRIAAGAPLAARLNKALLRRLSQGLCALTPAERDAAFAYVDSYDHREGVNAYLEGRTPHFLGH